MKLTSGTIYQHDEFEEVLVLGVYHVFEEYDLESEAGPVATRVVVFTAEWDGYGPMLSSIRTRPVDTFRGAVGEAIRTADVIEPPTDGESGHSEGN
ncbi:MAG: hypothetical protein ACI9PP_001256 [Halobacteriales archaeon]|jgi:hypothetical protein